MKKLNNAKWFTMGMVVCVLITTFVIPALAASFTKTAELAYPNIKITLNGQTMIPRDVDGNVVDPFIINGTTYLPVRGVSNMLGCDVGWDSSSNTVQLSSGNYEMYQLYIAGIYAQQAAGLYYQLTGLLASEIQSNGSSTYSSILKSQSDDIFNDIIDLNYRINDANEFCTKNNYTKASPYFNSLSLNVMTNLILAHTVCEQAVNGVNDKIINDFNTYSNDALNFINDISSGVDDEIYTYATTY